VIEVIGKRVKMIRKFIKTRFQVDAEKVENIDKVQLELVENILTAIVWSEGKDVGSWEIVKYIDNEDRTFQLEVDLLTAMNKPHPFEDLTITFFEPVDIEITGDEGEITLVVKRFDLEEKEPEEPEPPEAPEEPEVPEFEIPKIP